MDRSPNHSCCHHSLTATWTKIAGKLFHIRYPVGSPASKAPLCSCFQKVPHFTRWFFNPNILCLPCLQIAYATHKANTAHGLFLYVCKVRMGFSFSIVFLKKPNLLGHVTLTRNSNSMSFKKKVFFSSIAIICQEALLLKQKIWMVTAASFK